MLDAKDFMASYQNHQKALIEANGRNKAVVFDALAAAGVTTVTVEFDGEGDSGQIESVIACSGDSPAELPETPVTLHRASWQNETLTASTEPLREAIETLCYDYLEQEHGGWENNDGAFGTFAFDVAARSIELEFTGRYSDTYTNTHTF
jgi:uncharacterized protein DUF6878